MPSPTRPTPQPGLLCADRGVQLSAELTSAVAGARRRAVRTGDGQIDTAHLLHSLLEADPAVRDTFSDAEISRLLGYLVQRSIGYGLRWAGAVEDSGAVPVVREYAGWSPSAVTAMAAALAWAERCGVPRASGLGLLAALAGDPESRAVEALRRGGVEPEVLARRLADLAGSAPG